MPYVKTLVCLAASKKYRGLCVAGKELDAGGIGGWIRPVSSRERGELTPQECAVGSAIPRLLQLVRVPLRKPSPADYQTENHLINEAVRWATAGTFPKDRIAELLDNPDLLWRNGDDSSRGINDSVPEAVARGELKSSLYLIRPETLTISVGTESSSELKLRALFQYRGVTYRLAVTDPTAVAAYRERGPGVYKREGSRDVICVSLGEPLPSTGRCYKLVAGVIRV
jgi:hypothetical protein